VPCRRDALLPVPRNRMPASCSRHGSASLKQDLRTRCEWADLAKHMLNPWTMFTSISSGFTAMWN
jgi:hypothetical protein